MCDIIRSKLTTDNYEIVELIGYLRSTPTVLHTAISFQCLLLLK